jgi:hypothetical protein
VSQLNRFGLFRAVGAAVLLAFAASAWAQTTDMLMPSYIKPGINFKQYKQITIKPLKDNQDFLRQTFASAVRSGVESEGKFKVVNEHTPGTLQIDVRLVSLTPWASRDEKVETLGSGTLTFEAHVRDAATSELLAVYQGTQNVGKEYQANTPANKMTDIKQHFTDWGRNISKRLAAAQAL